MISHRRSGTHLTIDSIRQNVVGVGGRFVTLETLLPTHHEPCSLADFQTKIAARPWCIVKAHLRPELAEFQPYQPLSDYAQAILKRAKIIYVMRDGRDVMVSLFEYRRKIDPTIQSLSFGEFLRRPFMDDMNPASYWNRHVLSWASQDDVFSVSYERYHADFDGTISRISAFIGLPLRQPTYDMVRSRNPGAAQVSSAVLFRRGNVGDHTGYFLPADTAFFENEAGEAMKLYFEGLSGSK